MIVDEPDWLKLRSDFEEGAAERLSYWIQRLARGDGVVLPRIDENLGLAWATLLGQIGPEQSRLWEAWCAAAPLDVLPCAALHPAGDVQLLRALSTDRIERILRAAHLIAKDPAGYRKLSELRNACFPLWTLVATDAALLLVGNAEHDDRLATILERLSSR